MDVNFGSESEANAEVSETCIVCSDQQGATPLVVSIEVYEEMTLLLTL